MPDLPRQVAVVTGGASGIGFATGRALVAEGMVVVLADLNEAGVRDAARELGSVADAPGSVVGLALDVTQPAQPALLMSEVVDRFGRLDVLVNCAGVASKYPILDISVDAWDTMFNVHVRGSFLCLQAAAKHMASQGGGSVVNLSSIAAELGNPLAVHYAAAKGAVKMLTRAAAVALAPSAVRVNAVAPGITRTPLTDGRLQEPEVLAATLERIPMGRLGETDDIVQAVLFLASPRSGYMTGQTLIVDGGWTAQLYRNSYAEMQLSKMSTD